MYEKEDVDLRVVFTHSEFGGYCAFWHTQILALDLTLQALPCLTSLFLSDR